MHLFFIRTISPASSQAKRCSGLSNTGSSESQAKFPYDLCEYGSFRLKGCYKRVQNLTVPRRTSVYTRQLETVSPAQAGTCLTAPMNKVDIYLHWYFPTLYNELSADNNDQTYISVFRKHGTYCMYTGGRNIVKRN